MSAGIEEAGSRAAGAGPRARVLEQTAARPTDLLPHAPGGRPISTAALAWLLALLGWTALIATSGLRNGASFEPIDCWVAQTSREMLERGDWVVPYFSGEERMQKSPGAYWAVMLVSLASGGVVTEYTARVPNAIAAVAFVATIFWLTRRIAGERAAVFGGFAAASSGMVLYWSHRGASDFGLTALMTLSLASLWVALEDERPGIKRNALLLLGYFAAGLAMLYKMPMPLVCVGIPAVLYVLVRRRWEVLKTPWHLAGLALFLACWLPWAIGVVTQVPEAMYKWKVEYLDRFTGDLPNVEGQEKWPYYFLYIGSIATYCLPYTFSLFPAIGKAFRHQAGVRSDGRWFLLLWFLGLFAFFTISRGKEDRYILPALPPLLCLLGIELARFFDMSRPHNRRLVNIGAIAVWIGVPAAMAAFIYGVRKWHGLRGEAEGFVWSEVWPPFVIGAAIVAIGMGLAALLYRMRAGGLSFAAIVATMWATWLWMNPNVLPIVLAQRPFKDFAQQLREKIPPEAVADMRQIGSQDSRIIWYSDYRFARIIDQLELLNRQKGKRSLDREKRLIAEEMIRQLNSDQRRLFVMDYPTYVLFELGKTRLAEHMQQPAPKLHIWLASKLGKADRRFLLASNRPPGWAPVEITISDEARRKAEVELDRIERRLAAEDADAPPPATQPRDGR